MSALEKVRALLAETPGLERAADLAPVLLPVPQPFEGLLPGLRPGSTIEITGPGATSLALGLVARTSVTSWTAVAGLPELNLATASELGVAIDRIVVVAGAGIDVLASVVDAFDVVIARPDLGARDARKLCARVRERDAVLLSVGRAFEADVRFRSDVSGWEGIGRGHGYLRSRKLTVTMAGRGSAARGKRAAMWLPDENGNVSIAADATIVPLRLRTG